MGRPLDTPIGLQVARTARRLNRAFDADLVSAGGSLPIWLVLLSVKSSAGANQRQLAAAVGVDAATLTHHLNRMEEQGLIVRQRDPSNRRVHQVSLTTDGDRLFVRLATAARDFDGRLRVGLVDSEVSRVRALLSRLEANAGEGD
jgi:MarR family transcriptional regulator for hemolysin